MNKEYKLPYTGDQVNEKLSKIDTLATKAEVENKLDAAELPIAINEALTQAKASGEFDGKTPVRGTDYWTEDDKAEIKSYVDTAILGGAW